MKEECTRLYTPFLFPGEVRKNKGQLGKEGKKSPRGGVARRGREARGVDAKQDELAESGQVGAKGCFVLLYFFYLRRKGGWLRLFSCLCKTEI
jgi:hypothetical protein